MRKYSGCVKDNLPDSTHCGDIITAFNIHRSARVRVRTGTVGTSSMTMSAAAVDGDGMTMISRTRRRAADAVRVRSRACGCCRMCMTARACGACAVIVRGDLVDRQRDSRRAASRTEAIRRVRAQKETPLDFRP